METKRRDSRKGGPTGIMTRHDQMKWNQGFDKVMGRFITKRFPTYRRVVPVPTHVVWAWFVEDNVDPRFDIVCTGTVSSALRRSGWIQYHTRIRYTPPDNGDRACSATAYYLGDPGVGHGSWHPDKYRE